MYNGLQSVSWGGLVVALHDRVQGRVELAGGVEEGQLDDEEVLQDLATELRDEFSSGLGRTTCAKRD